MRECAAAPPAVPEATSELQGDEGTVHLIRVRVRVRVGVGLRVRVGVSVEPSRLAVPRRVSSTIW